MSEHNLFYYPYASFTNAQLPLLKVAALYFDKMVLLDPVGASWDTIGADHIARDGEGQKAEKMQEPFCAWRHRPAPLGLRLRGRPVGRPVVSNPNSSMTWKRAVESLNGRDSRSGKGS